MNRFDSRETGALPARRWLTLLAALATAVLATLALTAVLSSPADAAPPEGRGGGGGGGGGDSTVLARLAALEARVLELETTVEEQSTTIEGQNEALAALEDLLADASIEHVDGQRTLRFSGINLQLVNGESTTASANGTGNFIIGYNSRTETRPPECDDPEYADFWPGCAESPFSRSGSHYLIVGDLHEWTSYGGIVAGFRNTGSGPWASVTGGASNTASGLVSAVAGGIGNTASGLLSAVAGGEGNTASGDRSSVLGGMSNTASGLQSSVSGGSANTASGFRSSVLGGSGLQAVDDFACRPACS
jgi:trimeric autotransporter adhesin